MMSRAIYLLSCILAFVYCKSPDRSEKHGNLSEGEKKALIEQLDTIYDADQIDRKLVMAAIEEHGIKSEQVRELGKKIAKKDSSNLAAVKSIIEKYGWLGSDIVGKKGNSTLFLVIQHSDDQTREAFLPILRNALKNNTVSPQDLAKLEDRVAIHQGKKQLYGTQIGMDEHTEKYYLLPLEDPDNVDKRREKMGLGPLSEYLSQWQIKWE